MSQTVVNPYRYASAGFDDTLLKCYLKFNESSSPILNSSQSVSSVGNTSSTGQGIMTGGSFEQGGIPVGNSVLFDGVDDLMQLGSTSSLWNFWSNTDALWTMAFWMQGVDFGWDDYFIANGDGSEAQCLRFRLDGQGTYSGMNFLLKSGGTGNMIINGSTVSNFIPDLNWHFYCVTYDMSLSSNNLVVRRDNANEQTLSKSADTTADGDADYNPNMARKTTASSNYGNFLIGEFSIWNKVMSDSDQTALYNSGLGLEIY